MIPSQKLYSFSNKKFTKLSCELSVLKSYILNLEYKYISEVKLYFLGLFNLVDKDEQYRSIKEFDYRPQKVKPNDCLLNENKNKTHKQNETYYSQLNDSSDSTVNILLL